MSKKIVIRDVYDYASLMALVPHNADLIYDITVDKYGYVHDVGVEVTLTLSENPFGWDTLREDLDSIVKDCKFCWDTVSRYGYH